MSLDLNIYDEQLPFFAYGIFKPGQLAFKRVEDIVEYVETSATVSGVLYERDGLPLLKKINLGTVKGVLIKFRPELGMEAYSRISELEPDTQYKWSTIKVTTQKGQIESNVLLGIRPENGGIELEADQWAGQSDPFFSTALDIVDEILEANKEFSWDLKPLFRLEMGYLLLWCAIERYASFRYNLGKKANKKIERMAEDPVFCEALKREVTESREIRRADNADKVCLDSSSPLKSVRYYYQIRSNITHRGKGVVNDHAILLKSLRELLAIFRAVLQAAFAETSY